jgi:DeoR/GlpR family transcriptional regulator of sugar metabolism
MSKKDRQYNSVLSLLEKKGRLSTSDIMSILNVSESTARRVAIALEERGLAIRTFGGIQKPFYNNYYSYDDLEEKMLEQKQRIGQFASTLVTDNDIVFISGGTTVFQMVISLAEKLRDNKVKNMTVITSSFVNVEILAKYCRVILIGGQYRPERRDFAGLIAEKSIRHLSIGKCFMGVDAINTEDGLMSYDIETARIDELVIARSGSVTVLCDSTKIGKKGFITHAPISCVQNIVTDTGIPLPYKAEYEALGIKVYCV